MAGVSFQCGITASQTAIVARDVLNRFHDDPLILSQNLLHFLATGLASELSYIIYLHMQAAWVKVFSMNYRIVDYQSLQRSYKFRSWLFYESRFDIYGLAPHIMFPTVWLIKWNGVAASI